MSAPKPGTAEWLSQVQEETVDPSRRIVDPHHHLWRRPTGNYLLEDLWGDTEAVGSDGETHNIEKTVFVECRACYREDGPQHLRCIGETEFVAEIAAASAEGDGAVIAGIVSHANLTLGEEVADVLDAQRPATDCSAAFATAAPATRTRKPCESPVGRPRASTPAPTSAAA